MVRELPDNASQGGPEILKELGGIHWGFLPALLSLPLVGSDESGFQGVKFLLLVLAGLMASYDVACRRIPNPLTAITALSGLTWSFANGGLPGLTQGFLAGLLGFGMMAVFFFMGAVGGGDVKALGALATFLTPWGAVYLFVFTTFAGGAMALVIALARAWKTGGISLRAGPIMGQVRAAAGKTTLPYGVAIWAGLAILAFSGLKL